MDSSQVTVNVQYSEYETLSIKLKSDGLMHDLMAKIRAEYNISEEVILEGRIKVSFLANYFTGKWYDTIQSILDVQKSS